MIRDSDKPVFRISLYLFEWLVFLSGLYVMTLRALYIKFPQLEKRGYHHNDIIRRAYQKYVSHVSVPSAATSPNVSTPPSVVSSTRSSAAVSPRYLSVLGNLQEFCATIKVWPY